MNKYKFTGIIVLMGISLLGIIAVQIFWMQKAISVKEQQFNQQVTQALARAAHRIERNQNAYFLSSMFSRGGRYAPAVPYKQGNQPINDSIIIEFKDYVKNKSGNLRIIGENDPNVKVERKSKDGMETITYGFDTVIQSGNTMQRIQSYSSVTQPGMQNKNNKANRELPNSGTDLNSVMDQMFLEFTIRDVPMEERLGYSLVNPTLEYELKNMGIPLHFEYAISNYKGKIYPRLKTSGFKKDKLGKAYTTRLFPNEIMMRSDQLNVFFPEKRSFIYGSLIWLLMGSLIFTLIILVTFYYTLKIIFNQKKVSEIKTDFINNMTHEFKTPIATISLAADSISNPGILNSPDKVERFISVIKQENKRMNRQVESVLKMALIDKKDFNLNLKNIAVHPLIEQAVNNISIQVEQKGGKIALDLQASNDTLKVDETHFINIVFNLLDNANKYSLNAPPEITISTSQNNGYFYLEVSDKGIGMDSETQDRIFEKFYRYSTGNIHTVKGFGLGLSYVKAIVMAFKGTIGVKSQKGKGSNFTIKIPQTSINKQ